MYGRRKASRHKALGHKPPEERQTWSVVGSGRMQSPSEESDDTSERVGAEVEANEEQHKWQEKEMSGH